MGNSVLRGLSPKNSAFESIRHVHSPFKTENYDVSDFIPYTSEKIGVETI